MNIWDQVLQVGVSGLSSGCIYALAALGFFIVYSVTRVINFVQGEFVMLGGMLAATFYALGVPLVVAILLAIVITSVLGGLMWTAVISFTRKPTALSLILVTLGVSIAVRGAAYIVWGWEPRGLPFFLPVSAVNVAGAVIMSQSLVVMGSVLLLLVGLYLLFDKTLFGKGMKACSENPVAATLMSIDPKRMALYSFVLAACLGALGGALTAPLTSTTYEQGLIMSVKGFIAALVGGLNRAQGVIIGGIALGMTEALVGGFMVAGWKEIVALALFSVLLLFRPEGIWGAREIVRE